MGKIQKAVNTTTDNIQKGYTNSRVANSIANVSSAATDIVNVANNTVLLTLSKLWIGIGMFHPSKTEADSTGSLTHAKVASKINSGEGIKSSTGEIDRFKYSELYSLQLGEFFMPLSQTFTLQAKKKLNVSSLVDGVDIIQQTRKESKTISCSLKISLLGKVNTDGTIIDRTHENLKIVQRVGDSSAQDETVTQLTNKVIELSQFLSDLYESDAVFRVRNDMINNSFKIDYVMMSDFKFIPRTGMHTYTFEFSLTEVKYGENVLTFNLREIDSDESIKREITD